MNRKETRPSSAHAFGLPLKWKGTLLGTNLAKLRADLEASRDYLFDKTGVARDLFRACSARKLKTNREVIGADYDASFVVYIRWMMNTANTPNMLKALPNKPRGMH